MDVLTECRATLTAHGKSVAAKRMAEAEPGRATVCILRPEMDEGSERIASQATSERVIS